MTEVALVHRLSHTMKAIAAGLQAFASTEDSGSLIVTLKHSPHLKPKPPFTARAFWILCSPSCCKSLSSSRSKEPGQWENALKSLSSEINLLQGVVQ